MLFLFTASTHFPLRHSWFLLRLRVEQTEAYSFGVAVESVKIGAEKWNMRQRNWDVAKALTFLWPPLRLKAKIIIRLICLELKESIMDFLLPSSSPQTLVSGMNRFLFVSDIVGGTVRWRRYIDHLIMSLCNKEKTFEDMEPLLLQILRIGFFEIIKLGMPPYAVVNEQWPPVWLFMLRFSMKQ